MCVLGSGRHREAPVAAAGDGAARHLHPHRGRRPRAQREGLPQDPGQYFTTYTHIHTYTKTVYYYTDN